MFKKLIIYGLSFRTLVLFSYCYEFDSGMFYESAKFPLCVLINFFNNYKKKKLTFFIISEVSFYKIFIYSCIFSFVFCEKFLVNSKKITKFI